MPFHENRPVPPAGQAILGNLDTWQIREVPKEKWGFFGPLERVESIKAIFISGDAYGTTKNFEGVDSVAAMDVILKENPDRLLPGEPASNIYHYAFEKAQVGLKKWGPSRDQTILGHWPIGKSVDTVIRDYRKLSDGII